jgi:hypothetical protein
MRIDDSDGMFIMDTGSRSNDNFKDKCEVN